MEITPTNPKMKAQIEANKRYLRRVKEESDLLRKLISKIGRETIDYLLEVGESGIKRQEQQQTES